MPSRAKAEVEENAEPVPIEINHGYSRDYRPDLKQFTLALITSGDGDLSSYLNEWLPGAMIMGLCLLVYTIGQRQLRSSLAEAQSTIPNQRGKPTERPTLRWVLQCFQSVHLVWVSGRK